MDKSDWIRGLMVLTAILLIVAAGAILWALEWRSNPWISGHRVLSAEGAFALGLVATWLLRAAGIKVGSGEGLGGYFGD